MRGQRIRTAREDFRSHARFAGERGRGFGTEGSVFTEYAVVVGVCAIAISFAIVMMGPALSTAYYQNRQVVIAPVP